MGIAYGHNRNAVGSTILWYIQKALAHNGLMLFELAEGLCACEKFWCFIDYFVGLSL